MLDFIPMRIPLEPSRAQLKVSSAVCTNFVVVWIIAMFGTKDILTLTANGFAAIVALYLAIRAEEILEET